MIYLIGFTIHVITLHVLFNITCDFHIMFALPVISTVTVIFTLPVINIIVFSYMNFAILFLSYL